MHLSPTKSRSHSVAAQRVEVLDRFIPKRSTNSNKILLSGLRNRSDDTDDDLIEELSIMDKELHSLRRDNYRHRLEEMLFATPLQLPSSLKPADGDSTLPWRVNPRPSPKLSLHKRMWLPDLLDETGRWSTETVSLAACGLLAITADTSVYISSSRLLTRTATPSTPGPAVRLSNFPSRPTALCWCPRASEGLLVVAADDHEQQEHGIVWMWDCFEKVEVREACIGHVVMEGSEQSPSAGSINSISWHPYDNTIAFGASDGSVRICNENLVPVMLIPAFKSMVTKVVFSRDGSFLAYGSRSGKLKIIDLRRRCETNVPIRVAGSSIRHITWHPSEPGLLAVVATNGTTLILNITKEYAMTVRYPGDYGGYIHTTAVSFSALTGELVMAFYYEGRSQVAVLSSLNSVVDRVEEHESPVAVLCFSEDGTILASVGTDNKLCLWHFLGDGLTRDVKKWHRQMRRDRNSDVASRFGCVIR